MHNGTDGGHGFDNVCICVCWRTRSTVSFKKKTKNTRPSGECPYMSDKRLPYFGDHLSGLGGAGGAI